MNVSKHNAAFSGETTPQPIIVDYRDLVAYGEEVGVLKGQVLVTWESMVEDAFAASLTGESSPFEFASHELHKETIQDPLTCLDIVAYVPLHGTAWDSLNMSAVYKWMRQIKPEYEELKAQHTQPAEQALRKLRRIGVASNYLFLEKAAEHFIGGDTGIQTPDLLYAIQAL